MPPLYSSLYLFSRNRPGCKPHTAYRMEERGAASFTRARVHVGHGVGHRALPRLSLSLSLSLSLLPVFRCSRCLPRSRSLSPFCPETVPTEIRPRRYFRLKTVKKNRSPCQAKAENGPSRERSSSGTMTIEAEAAPAEGVGMGSQAKGSTAISQPCATLGSFAALNRTMPGNKLVGNERSAVGHGRRRCRSEKV